MKDFFVPKNLLLYADKMSIGVDFSVHGFSAGSAEYDGSLTAMVEIGSATPWSPAETTTALWLDAADADTITLASGVVSIWADKSGNGRNATEGVYRPTWSGTGIVFASKRLGLPTAAFPAGHTIVAVMQSTSTGATSTGIININSNPADDPELRIGVGNDVLDYFNGGYAIAHGASCMTHGIVGIEHSGSTTAALRRNGNLITESTRAGTLSSISEFTMGRYNKVAAYRNGTINEVLVFPTNAETRQKIEGYLAHKWDSLIGNTALVTALPSDHPYKSSPPTI